MNIGKAIHVRRVELGVTRTELAKRVGVSVAYISMIERNKRSVNVAMFVKIAENLCISATELMGMAERYY